MARPPRYLAEGERLVLEVRRHPLALAAPAAQMVLVLFLASVVGYVTGPDDGADVVDLVAGWTAAVFVVRFGWKLLQWWVDRIMITSKRIVEVSGVLTRKVSAMPLEKVTDMTYRRSVLGRLFGYGELVVESAGQQQALARIRLLPHPDVFYRTVTSLAAGLLDEAPLGGVRGSDEDDTGPLPRVIV